MKELARDLRSPHPDRPVLSLGSPVACPSRRPTGSRRPYAGSDVFTTPREALLREKPSRDARVIGSSPRARG